MREEEKEGRKGGGERRRRPEERGEEGEGEGGDKGKRKAEQQATPGPALRQDLEPAGRGRERLPRFCRAHTGSSLRASAGDPSPFHTQCRAKLALAWTICS